MNFASTDAWQRRGQQFFTCAAAIIIAFAGLITCTKLLTPFLDNHRSHVEKWAAHLLGRPVTIRAVHVEWSQYQPQITLNTVTIYNQNKTKKPFIQIDTIRVRLSILQSLLHHKIMPAQIIVAGANLQIRETNSGRKVVKGFKNLPTSFAASNTQETKFAELLRWVFSQYSLSIQKVNLKYTDKKGKLIAVTVKNLNLRNEHLDHLLVGKLIMHQDMPTEIDVSWHWHAHHLNLHTMTGGVYVNIQQLSLSHWLQAMNQPAFPINRGNVSMKLWFNFKDGLLNDGQGLFEAYGLQIGRAHHLQTINRLSGHIGMTRDGEEVVIVGDDIFLDLPAHLWPMNAVKIRIASHRKITGLEIKYLDFADSEEILRALTNLPTLHTWMVAGEIAHFQWHKNAPGRVKFSNLRAKNLQSLFEIKNLSGAATWEKNNAQIQLNSESTALQADHLFTSPMQLDAVTGDIQLAKLANHFVASTTNLHVKNSVLDLLMTGQIHIPIKSPNWWQHIHTDLTGEFNFLAINQLQYYLPLNYMSKDISLWLRQAFLAGEIINGDFKLEGNLSQFPFANNSGIFSMAGDIIHASLRFSPNWPILNNIDAQLHFENTGAVMDIHSASLPQIKISNVHAKFSQLDRADQSILHIDPFSFLFTNNEAQRFLKGTPLNTSLNPILQQFNVNAPVLLSLGFDIPLVYPSQLHYAGSLQFNNQQLQILPLNLSIDNVNGSLTFNQEKVWGSLQSSLAGNEVKTTIDIPLAQSANAKEPTIEMRASILTEWSQTLHQIILTMHPQINYWQFKIASAEMNGEGSWPISSLSNLPIQLQFDTLYLQKNNNPPFGSVIELAALPPITLTANDVQYDNKILGKLALQTVPATHGLAIKELTVQSPDFKLAAKGYWLNDHQGYLTQLNGDIETITMGHLLQQFEIASPHFVAEKGEINFDLHWPDAPYAISMKNITGALHLHLDKGRIISAETLSSKMGVGRVLSIFNVQTLSRRLSFDFSDMFQKGYSFDNVIGDAEINQGHLLTTNTLIEGPAAGMGINGKIGLNDQSYDFVLHVTPHVTASLPIAAALLTGQPAIGLAAFAVNTVILHSVSKMTTYYYAVTGSWDNPQWKIVR